MKALLSRLEAEHPNLRQTMLAALGNVNLTHLLDRQAGEAVQLIPCDCGRKARL
jgi:hypothetical protein